MANINLPSAIPGITIGGRFMPDANLIVLFAGQNIASLVYVTFRKGAATSGYQVPVGKTFRIMAWRLNSAAASNTNQPQIGYGDTDVGIQSGVGPNNAYYLTQSNAVYGLVIPGAGQSFESAVSFDIPTGKYPVVQIPATTPCGIVVYGYEI